MNDILEYFHGEWQASDLIAGILMALVVSAFVGRFYPRNTPPERINSSLQQAFFAFNFLIYGIVFVVANGIARGNETENFLVFVFVGAFFLGVAKAVYRRFLANEDADWWFSKVMEARLREQKSTKFE